MDESVDDTDKIARRSVGRRGGRGWMWAGEKMLLAKV